MYIRQNNCDLILSFFGSSEKSERRTYIQLSIVENESSLILQANCQPVNTIANAKPSATVARAVWYSITPQAALQATPL